MNVQKPPAVLLVEDEGLVRMLAADILADEGGYKVIEAVNADEALTFLDVRPDIRVLVADVDVPGNLNGYALARIVDMRWPGVWIIVSSGVTGPVPETCPRKRASSQRHTLPRPSSGSSRRQWVRHLLPSYRLSKPLWSSRQPRLSQRASKSISPIRGHRRGRGLAQPLQEPEKKSADASQTRPDVRFTGPSFEDAALSNPVRHRGLRRQGGSGRQ
jgi:CheY-like chemotaxis protein